MFSDNGLLNLDDGRQCYAMFDETSNNVSVVTIVFKQATDFDFTHKLIKQFRAQKENNYIIPICVNFVPILLNVMLNDAFVVGNDLYIIIKINKCHGIEPIKDMLEKDFKVTYEENIYGIQTINIRK